MPYLPPWAPRLGIASASSKAASVKGLPGKVKAALTRTFNASGKVGQGELLTMSTNAELEKRMVKKPRAKKGKSKRSK